MLPKTYAAGSCAPRLPERVSVVGGEDIIVLDSRRGTVEANWQKSFIFGSGIRLDTFLDARADFRLRLQFPQ